MLKVKGGVISECQRIIRDNLYHTNHHDGENILKYHDERSYVIEPLLGVSIQTSPNIDKYRSGKQRKDEGFKTERIFVPMPSVSANFTDVNMKQILADRGTPSALETS